MTLDIERVLAGHRRECADEWCAECLCGWLVPEDAEDFTAAHRAHVAVVLREQIAQVQAETWDAAIDWATACVDDDAREANPYRAAQVAPSRVPGEES